MMTLLLEYFGWTNFAWPIAFLALFAPILVRLLPAAKPAASSALRVPFYAALVSGEQTPQQGQKLFQILALIAWFLLVLAAARPQHVGEQVEVPLSGRDLLLAVDISGSMRQGDMIFQGRRMSRLTAVKAVAGEFLEQRDGDRLGLILFGSQAYLQTPLTFDRETTHTLLNEAQIGLAGQETAIGDALGLAVKHLQESDSEQRILILLTDGANTTGVVDPLEAAELAASEGLTVYTIGIGPEQQGLSGFSLFSSTSDLDEATLQTIADTTGGQYFRAKSPQELRSIYAELDRLEPVTSDPEIFRPVSERYYWPLGIALMLALLIALLRGYRGGYVG